MVELVSLPVNLRNSLGKKATRAERRDNRVPAIIYGNNEQNIPISIAVSYTHLTLPTIYSV